MTAKSSREAPIARLTFETISASPQPLGFFEVHAENYMGAGGIPRAHLGFLRENYALSLHGIGLNIDAREPLDRAHLARLKRLCDRYQPECFSEHLAWSSHGGLFFNDLLPLPYTEATLSSVIEHVDEAQSTLGRRLLVENPATYNALRSCRQSRGVFRRACDRNHKPTIRGATAMTQIPATHAGKPSGLPGAMLAAAAILDKIPQSLISLAARIFPAAVFWRSGETKVEGWHLSDSAIALFRDEYALPLIDPELAAKIAAFSEHFFPVLLVIGLASRLAALALLGMTAVIEIFVYPDAWPEHGVWATCFLVVIARGPGIFSLDHLLAKRWLRGENPP